MILSDYHRPVLLSKVIDLLQVKNGKFYIDATLGGGGYTLEILRRGGKVLGLDLDSDSIELVSKKEVDYVARKQLVLIRENFTKLKKCAAEAGYLKVSGIIFDLGLSSWQLDKSKRGFSYLKDEALDMRFDQNGGLTAWDIVNKYSERQIYEIFTKNSEELNSRAIAQAIVRARSLNGPVKTTFALNGIIKNVIKDDRLISYYKVLSRIYQAIRIEVNAELKNLTIGLAQSIELLRSGGRIVVLSYHSLEDRIVKRTFEKAEVTNKLKILTKKPIFADFYEVKNNSRSKSAKLRAVEKI